MALGAIEQHYARWVNRNREAGASRHVDGVRAAAWARGLDRSRVALSSCRSAMPTTGSSWSRGLSKLHRRKAAARRYLKETTGLELSPEKTKITPLTQGVEFLGHRVRLKWDDRWGWHARVEIPKAKVLDFRYRVKQLTKRRSAGLSLRHLLDELNAFARGWGHFYRHCLGAKRIFYSLDWYVSDRDLALAVQVPHHATAQAAATSPGEPKLSWTEGLADGGQGAVPARPSPGGAVPPRVDAPPGVRLAPSGKPDA